MARAEPHDQQVRAAVCIPAPYATVFAERSTEEVLGQLRMPAVRTRICCARKESERTRFTIRKRREGEMDRPARRPCGFIPAALWLLVLTMAVVTASAYTPDLGFTEGLTPEALAEALGRGDREAACSMIELRSRLVPATMPTLIRKAMEAELVSRDGQASDLWDRAEALATLYQEVSGSDFYVRYVASQRRRGPDQKFAWVRAQDAVDRAWEYRRKGTPDLFREGIEEAMSLMREIGDPRAEADGLLDLCDYLQSGTEGYEAHLECVRRACKLYLQAGDPQFHALSLKAMATAQTHRGRYAAALATLKQVKAIYESLSDDQMRMQTLVDIAWNRMRLAEHERALEAYDEAQELALQIEDRFQAAMILMYKGVVYENVARYDKANELYLRSQAILEEVGSESTVLLANLGTNFHNLGRPLKSLRYMHRFLGRVTGNKNSESYAYWVIAHDYEALDDLDMAETSYGRFIELARHTGGERHLIWGLTSLAGVQSRIGKTSQAERALGEVVALLEGLPINGVRLAELRRVADRYKGLGKRQVAERLYSTVASEATRLGAAAQLAKTHAALGLLAAEGQDTAAARKHVVEAFEGLDSLDDLSDRAEVLLQLAHVQEAVGDTDAALTTYRKGLKAYEPFIMTSFEAGEPENWRTARKRYERTMVLLEGAGATESDVASRDESFLLAQRFQALGLRQLLAKGKLGAREEAPPELVEREHRVHKALSAAQRELVRETVPEGHSVLAEQVRKLEDEYDMIEARLRMRRRRYANSGISKAVSVERAQSALDDGTAVLQYFLGEEHAFLWVLTRKDAVMLALPPAKEIEEAVRFYVKGLSSRASRDAYEGVSDELYSMLLEDAVPRLEGITSLLVVPDGALHLLPFEVLTRAGSGLPLVSRYAVGYLPAISLLLADDGERPRKGADKPEVLLVADARIDSGRLGGPMERGETPVPDELTERGFYERGGFDFHPLTHARREAEGIARILHGKAATSLLEGEEATEARIKSLDVRRFSVLHFATHALLDEAVPMRSAIALSLDEEGEEDGFLQMREVFNLDLDADLVVLSGCETGRGKLLEGEGVVGLPRAFLAAGARSLVVSLWRVDDRSTSMLMEAFYRNLNEGMGKAEALHRAKLSLMKVENGRYAHPYYWAPFVLIGDYR